MVCVFSNGGFGGIHGKLIERLKFRKEVDYEAPATRSIMIFQAGFSTGVTCQRCSSLRSTSSPTSMVSVGESA